MIIKCNDEGTNARPYGHALICGLRTVPRKITKKMDQKKQDKRSRCKTFIKYINLNHLMPTRYSIDVELKGVVSPDVLDDSTKKIAAQKESKSCLRRGLKLVRTGGSSRDLRSKLISFLALGNNK